MDDDRFQKIIKIKCNLCYRKDATEDRCMLFSAKHAGIELCVGPFNDQADRDKKRKKILKEAKQKADLEKAKREVMKSSYFRKRKIFDDD